MENKHIPIGSCREDVYIRRNIIVEALEKSSFVKNDIPNTKQKKKMYFTKIYELKATLTDLGDVKIIVGERNNKRIIHYCITCKKIKSS